MVVPTGTTHRWVPTGGDGAEPVAALVIEAHGHVGPPARYPSETASSTACTAATSTAP